MVMRVGDGPTTCPLPVLCHKEDDMADIGLNATSAAGVEAFNVFEPELFDADDWKLAVEYDDSGLPVKFLLLFNNGDL